jgi:threonine/homoserine/homoserine lactone efflux protein
LVEVDARTPVTGAVVAGSLAGYGIAVPVGAVATYLVALTARTSLKIGVCAALGVATADGLYALLAAVGGTTLAQAIRSITTPLRWVSALALIALALRIAVTALGQYRTNHPSGQADVAVPATSPRRAYLRLLGITLMNPTTVIYFAALVLGNRTTAVTTPLDETAFVLAAFFSAADFRCGTLEAADRAPCRLSSHIGLRHPLSLRGPFRASGR